MEWINDYYGEGARLELGHNFTIWAGYDTFKCDNDKRLPYCIRINKALLIKRFDTLQAAKEHAVKIGIKILKNQLDNLQQFYIENYR